MVLLTREKLNSQVVSYQPSCLVAGRQEPDEQDTDFAGDEGDQRDRDSMLEPITEIQARNHKDKDDGTARSTVQE